MPKLTTVVAVLALLVPATPAVAQDAPPPASPPPADAPSEAPPAAPVDASEPSASEPADVEAPASQPADVEAPASQPAEVAAPASQPAEVAPSSQPASAASQPAGDVDADADVDAGADEPGRTLLSGDVTRPDAMERRLVAYVATGVAAVALGTGITLGTLALGKYDCLNDVVVCNQGLEQPIVGEAFLDQKAEVETLSLLADMAYVVAAAATIVAVTGYIRGYWLTDEDAGAEVTP